MQYTMYRYIKKDYQNKCLIMPGAGGFVPAELTVEVKLCNLDLCHNLWASGTDRKGKVNYNYN